MSTKEFNFSSSLCTPSTCLLIQPCADYQLICGDPVSYQSLVSWVKRQSRLVELNDVLLPSGSTTADLHFQATHSCWSEYCKLYLLCRNLHRPLQVSRNQGWDSSTFSHPWHTECLSMCYRQQIPRRIHNSTSNYIHSSGHSQCTSTNAAWQSWVYCICE